MNQRLCYSFIFLFNLITFCFTQETNILLNGDLELFQPNYWSKINEGLGESEILWAEDHAAPHSQNITIPSLRSFKIIKLTTTTHEIGWRSENFADLYWNDAGSNDTYELSFYAKTEDVNILPIIQDDKIGVWFKFYYSGIIIAEEFLGVDQSVSSLEWNKYQTSVFIDTEPDSLIIELVMHKDVTGTVWFDNINCNTIGNWSMTTFNGDAEAPEGWMCWSYWDKLNFCALIDDPSAHSGNYSILLYENDLSDDEMVFFSEPVMIKPGSWYKFSVWVKTDSINTDTYFIGV